MKISFNYLFSNITSCRCGGTITDAVVLMWGPVSVTDTIAFSLIMKTSFIQMKFKSIAVAVNRLAPLGMQMGWHKALPTTQTASVTNNCPIFLWWKVSCNAMSFNPYPSLRAIAGNNNANCYCNELCQQGWFCWHQYVCIQETLIIVSYMLQHSGGMPPNYVASVGHTQLTLVAIVVLAWWWMSLLNG